MFSTALGYLCSILEKGFCEPNSNAFIKVLPDKSISESFSQMLTLLFPTSSKKREGGGGIERKGGEGYAFQFTLQLHRYLR